MRILHLIESHSTHTERILSHQRSSGDEAAVITFNNRAPAGPVTVIEPMRIAARLPYAHHWRGLARVLRAIRRFEPDVLHGHYLSTAALYLAACRGPALVGTAMGSDVLVDTRAAHARLFISSLRWTVDRFTSVAPHVTEKLIELGIPAAKITTFAWGVDTSLFHPAAEPPGNLVVVSTRSLEPMYDLPTLLRGFELFARAPVRAKLWLYGEGSLRGRLERHVRDARLESSVAFRGHVSAEVLAAALRQAAVYVSTSVSDGASVSLLEAMATGLVPVVSDIEANRSLVRSGENGLLFPPGDGVALAECLKRAVHDADLVSRARQMNPSFVRDHALWVTAMDRLRSVYEEALR